MNFQIFKKKSLLRKQPQHTYYFNKFLFLFVIIKLFSYSNSNKSSDHTFDLKIHNPLLNASDKKKIHKNFDKKVLLKSNFFNLKKLPFIDSLTFIHSSLNILTIIPTKIEPFYYIQWKNKSYMISKTSKTSGPFKKTLKAIPILKSQSQFPNQKTKDSVKDLLLGLQEKNLNPTLIHQDPILGFRVVLLNIDTTLGHPPFDKKILRFLKIYKKYKHSIKKLELNFKEKSFVTIFNKNKETRHETTIRTSS